MDTNYPLYNPEIWGGLECTINRVGDTFRDQLCYARHYERDDDIKKIAGLGIKKIRYPVLWEAHEQDGPGSNTDWTRTQQQLNNIRDSGMIPIAGLIHHGSGPLQTNLLSPDFARGLAAFAGKVAKEFPWIEYYTPVNEPLTTARFSGLYGCWYPHHKNDLSFARMLINQLKAVVLAMQEIRKINKNAKLVQTEDLAMVHSTPLMAYQAQFENKRRWLTCDLLCGRVNRQHFFWNYFTSVGIDEESLQFFLDNTCPPDIAGFNYYVTSERYLDENIQSYPEESWGTNGRHRYADVTAVREIKPAGIKNLLKQAWDRYHLPLALTEVHMNCTREEQLRWFKEAYDSCQQLAAEGVNIKGITAWSLLGAYDWDSLLTCDKGSYEAGVFDITHHELRPTALAKLVRSLATEGKFSHPVMEEKGWWHKSYLQSGNKVFKSEAPPILIIGSRGTLGNAFARLCERRSLNYRALSHQDCDITRPDQIEAAINKYKPWAVINACGYVRVDDAEDEREKCFLLNTKGPADLASLCNKYGIQLLTFSSDLVFDGKKISPYIELDSVKPLNVYGDSKAQSEIQVTKNFNDSLIIRTSSFFGPWDHYNFAHGVLNSLKENKPCFAVNDVIVSPTYVPHLADRSLDLLIDEEKGIWHLTNEGSVTWFDLAEELALRGGYHKDKIIPCLQKEMPWKAVRPVYSALESKKGIRLPSLENALSQYFTEKIN